jgi:hypothetical protein
MEDPFDYQSGSQYRAYNVFPGAPAYPQSMQGRPQAEMLMQPARPQGAPLATARSFPSIELELMNMAGVDAFGSHFASDGVISPPAPPRYLPVQLLRQMGIMK